MKTKCPKYNTDECMMCVTCPDKAAHVCGCGVYREQLSDVNKAKFDKFVN